MSCSAINTVGGGVLFPEYLLLGDWLGIGLLKGVAECLCICLVVLFCLLFFFPLFSSLVKLPLS